MLSRFQTFVPYLAVAVLLLFPVVANAQDPGYVILRRPQPTKPSPVVQPTPANRACTGLLPNCAFIREWQGMVPSHGELPPSPALHPVPTAPVMTPTPAAMYIPADLVVQEERSARQGHGDYPIYRVYRQPYAYGWFGASPNATRSRSHGYHRHRTQWTFQ